jgi:hypothetical protein
MHAHPRLHKMRAYWALGLQLQPVLAYGVGLIDGAFVRDVQDVGEHCGALNRHEGAFRHCGRLGKARKRTERGRGLSH